jgi:DNA topoisomerase I
VGSALVTEPRADPQLNGSILEAIDDAGLRYVSDDRPGIRRRRQGRGFSYIGTDGRPVSPKVRQRIEGIVIPPAWTDVWISPISNGHIQATGRDAKGRKQYRYHPRWREVRDTAKYERLAEFGEMLPDLRDRVDADLRRPGLPWDKAVALVVRLLDTTLIRVGNPEYAETNESYGLTTLRDEHVEVDGATIEFDFVGKGGLPRRVMLADRRLARVIKRCSELGGQELFAFVDSGHVLDIGSGDVNDYLRTQTGADITSKDFRTWGGSKAAATALAISRPPRSKTEADKQIIAAIDVAAEVLGNTRTVCRNCYVHPAVVTSFEDGTLQRHWERARTVGHLDRGERTLLKVLNN